MLYAATKQAILEHAKEVYPEEACGYIVGDRGRERYMRCKNVNPKPTDNFSIAAEETDSLREKYELLTLVHSHPDHDATPSELDKLACEETGMPWLIVSIREGEYAGECLFEPSGWKAPLIGRQFYHGVFDCYTIIRDWYYREAGIILPDFEREDDWWHKGGNMYMENFEKAGFYSVGQYPAEHRVGDVILMQYRSDVVNHGGVYIDRTLPKEHSNMYPVPNGMIHHLYGRLSDRVVYGSQWLEITRDVLRHKDYK